MKIVHTTPYDDLSLHVECINKIGKNEVHFVGQAACIVYTLVVITVLGRQQVVENAD